MEDSFFITSNKNPIYCIPSHSCITQIIQSKNHLTQEELLRQAYKNKILNLKQTYASYFFFQTLIQEYYCFFYPKTFNASATLDILLPASLQSQICCIFLSEDKNCFCFYKDHSLVFYKEFQNDIKICLQQVKLFFNYEASEIFCLCYPNTNTSLLALQKNHKLTPLLSLFSPQLSFEFSTISSPIILDNFYDLNPPNPNISYKHLKIITGILTIVFIFLSAITSGLAFYRSYLTRTLETLNQNIPSSSFASPIEEIRYLTEDNQKLLASLKHFSLLDSQKLKTLSYILSIVSHKNLLSVQFNAPHTFSFLFEKHFNITSLVVVLNNLGYRCKFFKEENGIHLEISR